MADYDREEQRRQRFEEKMARIREHAEARWERRGHRHSGSGGLFIGIVLAGIGVLLLLQNLGVLYIDDLWMYWPVILIVLGMTKVATGFGYRGRIWGAAMVFVGIVFLLDNLGLIRGHVWNYIWPVVLIILGVALLVRSIDHGNRWDWWNVPPGTGPGNKGAGAAPTVSAGGSSTSSSSLQNALNEWAFFGGLRRRVDSQEFEGGDVLAIFGGIRIDLDKAGTKLEEIRIEANAVFGGIDFRVPDTWAVTVRGTGIFGGYEDKTVEPRPAEGKPPHLIITGVALFGGVTVKN